MAKAFLTSFAVHAAAVGLLVWFAPDAQPMPSEKPQLIELQPLALLPSPPPAPAAPPVVVAVEPAPPEPQPEPQVVAEPPPPEPLPPTPPPPEPIAELPPPPVPEPLPPPEPLPEVKPDELIRSIAAPVEPAAPPPPPPKPKPAPKPRPQVAKSPPALPKAPQEVVPTAQPAPEPVVVSPSPTPAPLQEPASVLASAPTAALTLDSAYIGKLHSWLAQHKPDSARPMRGQRQGRVLIKFVIDREGRVLSKALEQSSGYEALDKAALETIERADPMPPFPVSFAAEQFTLIIPIDFQLR